MQLWVDFERWKSGMCCNVRCLRGVSFHFVLSLSFFSLAANVCGLLFGGAKSQFLVAYRYRLLIYLSFQFPLLPPLIANRCYQSGRFIVAKSCPCKFSQREILLTKLFHFSFEFLVLQQF
jgi:hypothetical protein